VDAQSIPGPGARFELHLPAEANLSPM
jgi:hypothetical protein